MLRHRRNLPPIATTASGTVSANFTCDDAASTVLTVEYARGPATFKVMG